MSEKIHYEKDGKIALIRMDDGKANAMQMEFCEQMMAALDKTEADKASALVITGRERFLSGGLDLKVLPTLPQPKLQATSKLFYDVMERLVLFPKPLVVASGGHAIAGGMILYLTGDYRIALDDDSHKYGLNETTNGIPLGGVMTGICKIGIPPQHQTDLVLQAHMITAEETLARGITNELVAGADRLLPRALEAAKRLSALNAVAYAATKRNLRKPVIDEAKAFAKAEAESGNAPGGNFFAALQI